MATRGKPRRTEASGTERPARAADPVALSARISTEEHKDADTVPAQLTFLRRFVDLHGLPVAGEYVDEGVSGALPLDERPDGQRLHAGAEAGRFGTVLFMRVSRLGRSLRALIDAHDQLERLGFAIRSGTEPLDTATPIGRFIFQLHGSEAELDRETIAEPTSRGRDAAGLAAVGPPDGRQAVGRRRSGPGRGTGVGGRAGDGAHRRTRGGDVRLAPRPKAATGLSVPGRPDRVTAHRRAPLRGPAA